MIVEKYTSHNLRKEIGKELWLLRQKMSLSQRNLAGRVNLTPKEVDKAELG